MTPDIKAEIKLRQKLHKEKKHEEWKKQANKIRKMIKKRKRSFFKKYTNGNPNWWKEVNELRNISNKKSIDSQTCNKLNDYFHGKWVNKQANISVHTYRELNNSPTILQ